MELPVQAAKAHLRDLGWASRLGCRGHRGQAGAPLGFEWRTSHSLHSPHCDQQAATCLPSALHCPVRTCLEHPGILLSRKMIAWLSERACDGGCASQSQATCLGCHCILPSQTSCELAHAQEEQDSAPPAVELCGPCNMLLGAGDWAQMWSCGVPARPCLVKGLTLCPQQGVAIGILS